jgi:hypothetical protein
MITAILRRRLSKINWKWNHVLYINRTIDIVLKAYEIEIIKKFIKQCWRAQNSIISYMRISLDFLIKHYYILREYSRRGIDLADINVLKLKSESDIQSYFV